MESSTNSSMKYRMENKRYQTIFCYFTFLEKGSFCGCAIGPSVPSQRWTSHWQILSKFNNGSQSYEVILGLVKVGKRIEIQINTPIYLPVKKQLASYAFNGSHDSSHVMNWNMKTGQPTSQHKASSQPYDSYQRASPYRCGYGNNRTVGCSLPRVVHSLVTVTEF